MRGALTPAQGGNTMKTTTTMMLATAALLASAATGSAQTMKAEIPFAFHAGDTRLQPGTYQVTLSPGNGIPRLQIYNYDDHKGALTLVQTVDRLTRKSPNGSSVILTFECTDGHCSLARLWDGST